MEKKLFLICTFLWATLAAILLNGRAARGDAMVMGTVFCDQCLVGKPSMWALPVHDATVTLDCNIAVKNSEVKTSMIGTFAFEVSGDADLSSCSAHLTGGAYSSCSEMGSAEQILKLDWKMFGQSFYSVAPMFFKPDKPMSFCPESKPSPSSPAAPDTKPPSTPDVKPPSISLPPPPFLNASSCSYEEWTKPEHFCYWKFLAPNETVDEAFGPAVAHTGYGSGLTIMDGLNGERTSARWPYASKSYRRLLRQTITALLNSYSSLKFKYPPLTVIAKFADAVNSNSTSAAAKCAADFFSANTESNCLLETCK